MSNTIDVFTEIYVQVHSDADVSAEVTAATHSDNDVFAEITVQKRADSEVSAEITSSVFDNNEVSAEVTASTGYNHDVHSELSVKQTADSELLTEMTVPAHSDNDVYTEVTSTIRFNNDVLTEITVPVKVENTMHAKFFMYGVGSKEVLTDIQPRAIGHRTIDSEMYIRALRSKDLRTEITSIYRGNSDVYVEIQPMGFVQIPAVIEIRPHTNMEVIFETKKPPIISESYFPIQDAFTKKEAAFQTINYGKSSSMVIGNNDEFESFINFQHRKLDNRYVITDIFMELSYYGELVDGYNINVHTASREWNQNGITYRNKPPKAELVTREYEVDRERKKLRFNVTDIASKWFRGEAVNYGFIVSTTSPESLFLRTSESYLPPRLFVQYYDSVVPSTGRSQVRSEIFVYNKGAGDALAEIEVASTFSFSRIPTEIYVHRPEVPVASDKHSEIVISKPAIGTEITAIRSDDSAVFAVVTARSEEQIREKRAVISVSRDFALTEVTARQYDESPIESDIYVNRDRVLTEITSRVEDNSNIYVEITANDIHVRYIEAEITPRVIRSSDIFVEIEPNIKSDVATEITVVRGSVRSEITVARNENEEVPTEIIARAIDESTIQSEMTVSKDRVLANITAAIREDSDIYTEIYASHRSEVNAEIYVSNRSEVFVEIDVIGASMRRAEIAVSRPEVRTEIIVPYWDENDVLTEIRPRILFADDVRVEITPDLRNKGEDAVYSEIYVSHTSAIEAEIDVIGASKKETEIAVSRPDVRSEIMVPYHDNSDVLTSIQPRIVFADDVYVEITMGKVPKGYVFIL